MEYALQKDLFRLRSHKSSSLMSSITKSLQVPSSIVQPIGSYNHSASLPSRQPNDTKFNNSTLITSKHSNLSSPLLPQFDLYKKPSQLKASFSTREGFKKSSKFVVRCSIGPEEFSQVYDLAVGVGLPCTVMECGDIIYRSTLPPSDPFKLTTGGVILALSVFGYLWATPGVAPGFWDMFVLAPLENKIRPTYTKEDLVLGKKLGEGAFGTVYKASFSNPPSGKQKDLVVKRASEFGAVEIWMNERVRRACPNSCAEFITGFSQKNARTKNDEFWLVWKYEGDSTLADVLSSRDFPYNIEDSVLGSNAAKKLPKGSPERENKIIQALMNQLLTSLNNLHSIGIVHRDIKPQNIIFCKESGTLKIIDLGAAADLRVGINYVPKEFLLDPRYAAPEQYIMSTQTPSAPSPPVATTLSPVLWQLNLPDRFDVYSAGLIFLQLAFPNLRNDNGLIQFNRQLKRCDYDLSAWREMMTGKRGAVSSDMARGFEIMDLDDGAAWDLVQTMIRFKGRERTSASGALIHPFFYPGVVPLLQRLRLYVLRQAYSNKSEILESFLYFMSKSWSKEEGALSEMQLDDLIEKQKLLKKDTFQRNAVASVLKVKRQIARTIKETNRKDVSWWNRWES